MNCEFFRATAAKKPARTHAIDRTRVYATGHSHGSVMTQVLAMAMPRGIRGGRRPVRVLFFKGSDMDIRALPEIRKP